MGVFNTSWVGVLFDLGEGGCRVGRRLQGRREGACEDTERVSNCAKLLFVLKQLYVEPLNGKFFEQHFLYFHFLVLLTVNTQRGMLTFQCLLHEHE